ncbi:hypothetical protein M9Y10_044843 [Tritrichomonas musculus]|uniref:Uncharacterized protein n=1 Tax=Tritrichomonas musculus TaxID=1915356 RepID=A0ABR2JTK0_9EUKA
MSSNASSRISNSSRASTAMTFEESEQKIHRLQEAIETASMMKNYERSAQLQAILDKHMIIHNKLLAERKVQDNTIIINELETAKLEKESQILRSLINQMQNIYASYDRDYADLEKRHNEKIAELQNTFARPKYTTLPTSASMRALQRAESFYAKNKDFKAAAAIRNQIRQQSQREMNDFKQSTSNTIDAKIRDAVRHYQTEQKCFSERLQSEKNLLKKETLKTIVSLDNRFKNLLKKQTGTSDHDFELMTEFKNTVFNSIDNEFAQFAKNLQEQYGAPNPSSENLVAPDPRPIQLLPYQTLGKSTNMNNSRTTSSRDIKTARSPRRYNRMSTSNSLRSQDDPVQTALERRNRAFDISQPLSSH